MSARKPRGKKRPAETPPLVGHSIALTPADQDTLERLSKDLSDYVGRRVSNSAVLRAMLRHAARQPYQWVLAELAPVVEQEMGSGRVWGKREES